MTQVLQLFFGLLALIAAFIVPGLGLGMYSAMTLKVQLNIRRLKESGVLPDESSLDGEILRGLEQQSANVFFAIAFAFLLLGVLLVVGSRRIGNLETKLAEANAKLAAKEANAVASVAGPA